MHSDTNLGLVLKIHVWLWAAVRSLAIVVDTERILSQQVMGSSGFHEPRCNSYWFLQETWKQHGQLESREVKVAVSRISNIFWDVSFGRISLRNARETPLQPVVVAIGEYQLLLVGDGEQLLLVGGGEPFLVGDRLLLVGSGDQLLLVGRGEPFIVVVGNYQLLIVMGGGPFVVASGVSFIVVDGNSKLLIVVGGGIVVGSENQPIRNPHSDVSGELHTILLFFDEVDSTKTPEGCFVGHAIPPNALFRLLNTDTIVSHDHYRIILNMGRDYLLFNNDNMRISGPL